MCESQCFCDNLDLILMILNRSINKYESLKFIKKHGAIYLVRTLISLLFDLIALITSIVSNQISDDYAYFFKIYFPILYTYCLLSSIGIMIFLKKTKIDEKRSIRIFLAELVNKIILLIISVFFLANTGETQGEEMENDREQYNALIYFKDGVLSTLLFMYFYSIINVFMDMCEIAIIAPLKLIKIIYLKCKAENKIHPNNFKLVNYKKY
ncbi:unnamed protein product [Brachionus calyciflorus]|uniref:Uncharacterized protein n=1 Tax=Brachionus calyciflorus TaxID=104777 RepID=A0A813XFA4_9BILA|nr:unnamed protein product [Brachionus calyciflorus]